MLLLLVVVVIMMWWCLCTRVCRGWRGGGIGMGRWGVGLRLLAHVCVCSCVRACVRACVRGCVRARVCACVCVCGGGGGGALLNPHVCAHIRVHMET